MPLIVHLNARSLPNKDDDFIYIINALEKTPDIICVREPVKYCPDPGYAGVSSGRCVTYTKKNLPAVHDLLASVSSSCIQTRIEIEGKTYEIFNCYSPPKSSNVELPISKINSKGPTLILGDFNAPCVFWGYLQDSPKKKQLKKALEDTGFTFPNTPGQYTRIGGANQNNTSPDLTWVRHLPKGTQWDLLPDNIWSDHLPIVIAWGEISTM